MSKKSNQVLSYKLQKPDEPQALLLRHILVPYDDSVFSDAAFDIALDLAKKYGAKVSAVSVMYSGIVGSSFLDLGAHQTSIERTRLRRLSKIFKEMKLLAARYRVPLTTEVIVSSYVSETILAFASSQKADLIVMGTRGRTGGPKHMRIGSVAMDVSQYSSCPVLFAK
jgi:nucleotide-binding universal stress UspA family protein